MKISSITWQDTIPQVDLDDSAEASGLSMDDEEFAAFYVRTARPVRSYLVHVSGNPALADDLLQESYLRFLCAARWDDGEAACRRYLFRIATNLLRDHWRRRSPASLEALPEEAFAVDQSRDIDRVESQTMLAPALERMSPRERQLLWLAYAEGATHREIADITGLRAAGIRILLFRARRKLARFLRQRSAAPEKTL
jgi:RNA polymerase sigma-70 factor (ECF subfamily)